MGGHGGRQASFLGSGGDAPSPPTRGNPDMVYTETDTLSNSLL